VNCPAEGCLALNIHHPALSGIHRRSDPIRAPKGCISQSDDREGINLPCFPAVHIHQQHALLDHLLDNFLNSIAAVNALADSFFHCPAVYHVLSFFFCPVIRFTHEISDDAKLGRKLLLVLHQARAIFNDARDRRGIKRREGIVFHHGMDEKTVFMLTFRGAFHFGGKFRPHFEEFGKVLVVSAQHVKKHRRTD